MDVKITLISALAILISIMLHELAHGYVAYRFGDTTAKNDGRLSLNPLKHIDFIGLISLIVFKFGWAKPVPVNFSRLKPKKLGAVLVSIAGCLTNFITAFIATILLMLQIKYFENLNGLNTFLMLLISYSIAFGVFNLIPIPPLDGSKLILIFLPKKANYFVYRYERYFFFLLMGLAMSGVLSKITGPIIEYISRTFFILAYRIAV